MMTKVMTATIGRRYLCVCFTLLWCVAVTLRINATHKQHIGWFFISTQKPAELRLIVWYNTNAETRTNNTVESIW